MSKILLSVNGQASFDFDKDSELEEGQLVFLDKMDSDMDKGIKINGISYKAPDKNKRAEFVVLNLIKALQQNNQAVITASCAYIANRLPEVEEVHVNDMGSGISIEFI